MKTLLITGCHRSGTSLLASMVGNHPDIALIYEDYYDSWKKILCKRYIGTKAVIPSIMLNKKRSNLYTSLFRKILFLRRKLKMPRAVGFLPYCINDFEKVIFISRNKEDNIRSIFNRTYYPMWSAEQDYEISEQIKRKLRMRNNVYFVTLQDLTTEPVRIMTEICDFLGLQYKALLMLEGYKLNPAYDNDMIEKKK